MAKKQNHFLFPLICLFAWIASLVCTSANDFQYFDREIDYWNQKKEVPASKEPKTALQENKSSTSFDWKKHLDPKNPEFFKEGDYTPPETFMEVARNPSDENLKKWFQYIDRKNEIASRLQVRMGEYLAKEGKNLEPSVKDSLQAQVASIHKIPLDAKRYRFRLYFDSTCPHCRQMFETLKTLQEKGFYVEARQIDARSEGLENLPLPTVRASKEEIEKYQIQSVPFLLIGDLKNQVVYQITGFQTPESLFEYLHQQPTVSPKGRKN